MPLWEKGLIAIAINTILIIILFKVINVVDKKVVINETEAEIIKEIFYVFR